MVIQYDQQSSRVTVSDNCLDSANPSPAKRKGPGNYCPNPDSQVYVSLIFVLFSFWGSAKLMIFNRNVLVYSNLGFNPYRTLPLCFRKCYRKMQLLEGEKGQGYMTTLEQCCVTRFCLVESKNNLGTGVSCGIFIIYL